MTNVVELPRREAWVATLVWPLPEPLRLTTGEESARAMIHGLVAQGRRWIIDCDVERDARYCDGVIHATFEVTEAFAMDFRNDAFRTESILNSVMPGATLTVKRDVWTRSAAQDTALEAVDFERWHPRCVALLDVLADSEHPEADAERYAVLELLRSAVRKVV